MYFSKTIVKLIFLLVITHEIILTLALLGTHGFALQKI